MRVSWKWLSDYVTLPEAVEVVADRLTMSGSNLDSIERVGDDVVLDVEVTSNRADCLGHMGIAREIAVLFAAELRLPAVEVSSAGAALEGSLSVRIQSHDLSRRYTARVIEAVRVGPSPAWLRERLEAVGVKSINNVVDVTNYVMLECGQPLHAFDLGALRGNEIVVRPSQEGELFVGIDHREHRLPAGLCVIADSQRPVALAGVIGGADSEISERTVDVVIESAEFAPGMVRQASRALRLRTDASHRFERALDREGVDWASRRCCQLILQVAGGRLRAGVAEAGERPATRESFLFRQSRVTRLLGIEVSAAECVSILERLGVTLHPSSAGEWMATPPTWRRDLTREVDLIEEIARIHGYDRIPEDRPVAMSVSSKSSRQRVQERVRTVLASWGLDEALTCSLVPAVWSERLGDTRLSDVLAVQQGMEGVLDRASQTAGAVDRLRRSLIPSLLEVRRINEFRGNQDSDVFEMAKVYHPREGALPDERLCLAWVAGGGFFAAKGVIESLCRELGIADVAFVGTRETSWLDGVKQVRIEAAGQVVGVLGDLHRTVMDAFQLRREVTAVELDLDVLLAGADLTARHRPISAFPPVDRDFNFVLEERVRWSDLAAAVRRAGGERIESVEYRETFRAPDRDGADRKRVLLSVRLRDRERTLTGADVEGVAAAIVSAVGSEFGGRLLG